MQIHLDNTHSVGLGDHICLISLLCDLNTPVELLIDNRWDTHKKLSHYQKVLNIPEEQVKFTLIDSNGTFNNYGWPLKTFSPYYSANKVSVLGQTLSTTEQTEKTFIGMAAYNGTGMWMDSDRNSINFDFYKTRNNGNENIFPDCRYQPIEFWCDAYKFIQTRNFDIIDLDGMGLSFEEKVYFMVKHCKAIIAYEGGIAHLAHMLNIPCFILDWNLPTPSTVFGEYHVELVHQSPGAYVIKSKEDFLNWSHEQFDQTIVSLKNGYSNNRIVNKELVLDFSEALKNNLVLKDQSDNEILRTNTFSQSLTELFKLKR
jgi:hypothetical protein